MVATQTDIENAYWEWCQFYGKAMDPSRLPVFASNFRANEEFRASTGTARQLNEFADRTPQEYRDIKESKRRRTTKSLMAPNLNMEPSLFQSMDQSSRLFDARRRGNSYIDYNDNFDRRQPPMKDPWRRPEPSSDNLAVGSMFNENDQSQQWKKPRRRQQPRARNDSLGVGSIFEEYDQSQQQRLPRQQMRNVPAQIEPPSLFDQMNQPAASTQQRPYPPQPFYDPYLDEGPPLPPRSPPYADSYPDIRFERKYESPLTSPSGAFLSNNNNNSKSSMKSGIGGMNPFSTPEDRVRRRAQEEKQRIAEARRRNNAPSFAMEQMLRPLVQPMKKSKLFTPNAPTPARMREAYQQWCAKYGKRPSEQGFQAFSTNKRDLDDYNQRTGSRLQLNAYSDLSSSDFGRLQRDRVSSLSPNGHSPNYLNNLKSASPSPSTYYDAYSPSSGSTTFSPYTDSGSFGYSERDRAELLERESRGVQRRVEEQRRRLSDAQAQLSYRSELTEQDAATVSRRMAAEAARLKAEVESKKIQAEDAKRRYQLEQSRIAAEAETVKRREAAERKRLAEARKQIAIEAQKAIKEAEMERKKIASEQSRLEVEMETRRKNAERRRRQVEKEEAKRRADEERASAREEKARMAAFEEAQRKAEIERQRAAKEDAIERKRLEKEYREREKIEERERKRLLREQEKQVKIARIAAEKERKLLAEEEARQAALRRKRETEVRRSQIAEERRLAEEKARLTEQEVLLMRVEDEKRRTAEQRRKKEERGIVSRLAYQKWCLQYGRPSSEERFKIFAKNYYEVKRYAKITNTPVQMNEYSDLSPAEFQQRIAGEEAQAVLKREAKFRAQEEDRKVVEAAAKRKADEERLRAAVKEEKTMATKARLEQSSEDKKLRAASKVEQDKATTKELKRRIGDQKLKAAETRRKRERLLEVKAENVPDEEYSNIPFAARKFPEREGYNVMPPDYYAKAPMDWTSVGGPQDTSLESGWDPSSNQAYLLPESFTSPIDYLNDAEVEDATIIDNAGEEDAEEYAEFLEFLGMDPDREEWVEDNVRGTFVLAGTNGRQSVKQKLEIGVVPSLSMWSQNPDGSIKGYVSNSAEFKTGTKITTSPAVSEVKANLVVTTESGSKYKLVGPAVSDEKKEIME